MYCEIHLALCFGGFHLVFYLSFQRDDAQASDNVLTNDTSDSR
jgi:hypothetical protein